MYNKGYNGQRYSSLDQINTGNAADLSPVCVLQLGEAGTSFQSNPIIHDGRLYITTPHSTYALNARTCEPLWEHVYTPTGPEAFTTNRGVAIAGGRLFRGTTDAHFLALDAMTGDLLWDVQVVDANKGYFLSSSPIVWRDMVFTGTAGADWGAPGFMFALDVNDGRIIWQFNEVKADTFGSAQAASTGGGSSWTSYAFDEAEGLIYVPVGNPAPDFACDYRPGDNLYTNSVVVLDATSGELRRWYQQIPHDCLDRDTAAAPMLFELDDGSRRMAVASKNGLLYVYDDDLQGEAASGTDAEGQAHPPAAQQTARTDLQPQQGQPQSSVADALLYTVAVTTRSNVTAKPTTEGVHVCPGINGGVEWYGPTFDPQTSTLFVNSVDWCTTFTLGEVRYTPGALFFGGSFEFDPVSKGSGWTYAIDAASGQVLWQYHSPRPMVAGLVPTAGNVIFTGELTGNFLTLDSNTGEVLYKFNTGGPIGGGIATYQLDDRQYVAVASGNASRTWTPDTGAAATVLIFALPE
jgi:PQQ-dependent dehydrogenase (methanol/ethanol family)